MAIIKYVKQHLHVRPNSIFYKLIRCFVRGVTMKRIWVCAAYAIAALIAIGVTLKQILMP